MTERFGPYEIEAPLGRGGMGEVHRAVDLRKGRAVALKRLPAELSGDPTLEERFRREAELAARLTEPHVIPIHDYGQIDGRLFLDMRLVEGVTVAQLLRAGPIDPRRAVAVLDQVAVALDAAHDAGLVHRDVKPSNVLLTTPHPESPAHDFAYLIDFGIAAGASSGGRLTSPGSAMGTAAYMAPERFTGGGEDDPRSDIYALGCLLFEMLAGAPPFDGETIVGLMWQHTHAPPPSVAARTALPPAFDGVVAAALAKDPAQRPQRAGHLAEAARRALMAPPPAPRPAAPPAQSRTRVRAGLRTAGTVTALIAASAWLLVALGTLLAVGATGAAQLGVAGVVGSMCAAGAGLSGRGRRPNLAGGLAWILLAVSVVAVVVTLVNDS